jgi:putative ABC transport system permease protein
VWVNISLGNRYFAGQNPIGRHYRDDIGNKIGEPVEIVGVVKDAKYGMLREEILPTALVAASQDTKPRQQPSVTFEVRVAGEPASVLSAVKSAIAEVNRHVSLQFKSLAVQVDESLARERLLAILSGFFGALALLLAMIGLYEVMSYNVARRRNEIGIRMALGADRSRVLRLVLGEAAILIGMGLAIGLGAAIGTTRFVEGFLFGMKPNDPRMLALAAGALASLAALVGFLPARRASLLDPMTALREE